MYAVVVLLNNGIEGVENDSVHLFGSEDEAIRWIGDVFIRAGWITPENEQLHYVGTRLHNSLAEAVEDVQNNGLSPMEFFHEYPVVKR